jgi:hypothetical protein
MFILLVSAPVPITGAVRCVAAQPHRFPLAPSAMLSRERFRRQKTALHHYENFISAGF